MIQEAFNFEANTSGIRGKQPETHKSAHGTSIKALLCQIMSEAQKPLIEADFVRILLIQYGRHASGSSVSRHLRYLAREGKVKGEYVVINNVKKSWKEWTRKGEN